MITSEDFLANLGAMPLEVFADWLEEHGDPFHRKVRELLEEDKTTPPANLGTVCAPDHPAWRGSFSGHVWATFSTGLEPYSFFNNVPFASPSGRRQVKHWCLACKEARYEWAETLQTATARLYTEGGKSDRDEVLGIFKLISGGITAMEMENVVFAPDVGDTYEEEKAKHGRKKEKGKGRGKAGIHKNCDKASQATPVKDRSDQS